MTKAELRKTYLLKRLSLGESEYLSFNHQISDLFFSNFDLSTIKTIHTYLPIIKNKEPDTWLIINKINREFPTVRISVPRVRNNILENFFFEGTHQLEKNAWDILEPKEGIPTDAEKIDMVIVPLLAFDQKGNRVGYGKGFYDKFLKNCSQTCKKVGLSFFEPIDFIDDTKDFDVALTHCITPVKVHTF
jgi:5-formyltetrahydrofolate cyclo-ligase